MPELRLVHQGGVSILSGVRLCTRSSGRHRRDTSASPSTVRRRRSLRPALPPHSRGSRAQDSRHPRDHRRRAQAGHGSVLRPRRLDRDRRAPRSRGIPRPPRSVLGAGVPSDLSLRGYRQSACRRRHDGLVRCARGARGRPLPSRASRVGDPASARRIQSTRRRSPRSQPHGAHRYPHRARRGRDRRQRPQDGLHGDRRHHQPRLAPPVARRAGHDPGERIDRPTRAGVLRGARRRPLRDPRQDRAGDGVRGRRTK